MAILTRNAIRSLGGSTEFAGRPLRQAAGRLSRLHSGAATSRSAGRDRRITWRTLLSRADQAIGRLDGVNLTLPDPDLFVAMYVRQEAVLSSQIEGTQSSLDDVLAFELDPEGLEIPADVTEVVNYVRAMNYGLDRLETLPLSLRLIQEIHGVLLEDVRGADKAAWRVSVVTELDRRWPCAARTCHVCASPGARHVGVRSITSSDFSMRTTVFRSSFMSGSRTRNSRRSTHFSMAMDALDDCSSPSSFAMRGYCSAQCFI